MKYCSSLLHARCMMVIKRWRLDFHREFEEADMDLTFTLFFPIINSSVFHKRQWLTHEWKEENQKMGPRQETFQKTSISKHVQMLREHFRICNSPLMQHVKRLFDQTTINWYISRLMYIPRVPSLVVGSWDTITFSNRQLDSLFDINHTHGDWCDARTNRP